jgi:hypothetical protein
MRVLVSAYRKVVAEPGWNLLQKATRLKAYSPNQGRVNRFSVADVDDEGPRKGECHAD